MGRIILVIICQLTFFNSYAMNLSDTINAVSPELNQLMNRLNGAGMTEDIGSLVNQLQGMQQMMEGQEIGALLLEEPAGQGQVYAFEVPADLIDILPEGNRMLGNANCFLTPFYAMIAFDAMHEGNDGKGYSFTFSLNIVNPAVQNEEINGFREMFTLNFKRELGSVKNGVHPVTEEKISHIKTKEWGAGGSYKWTSQWDGKEQVTWSSFYTGKVEDVFFTMSADGIDSVVPERVVDKLANLAVERITYKSLKSRVIE